MFLRERSSSAFKLLARLARNFFEIVRQIGDCREIMSYGSSPPRQHQQQAVWELLKAVVSERCAVCAFFSSCARLRMGIRRSVAEIGARTRVLRVIRTLRERVFDFL